MATVSATGPSGDNVSSSVQSRLQQEISNLANSNRPPPPSLKTNPIIRILEDCIEQIGVVSLLPTLLNSPETLFPNLEKKVVKALKEHKADEEAYQAQIQNEQLSPTEQAIAVNTFENSVRKILSLLSELLTKREVFKALELDKVNESETKKIRHGLCELKNVILGRLVTTMAEERERAQIMEKLKKTIASHQNKIDLTNKEIGMAKKVRDDNMISQLSKWTEKEKRLKSAMQQMEKDLKGFMAQTQDKAEKEKEALRDASEKKRGRRQEDVNQLTTRLNALIAEHKEVERRQMDFREESDLQNWMQKYDAEIGDKHADMVRLQGLYDNDLAEMRLLEKKVSFFNSEYSDIIEKRERIMEEKEQRKRDRELQIQVAIRIQALWRGYVVRKVYKSKLGKGKGKKGKGGKGKGKKK